MGDFDQQMEAFTNQLERQAERDAERADKKARAAEPHESEEARTRRQAIAGKRQSLELTRARLAASLAATGPGRYRDQLEHSLAALDEELAALEA